MRSAYNSHTQRKKNISSDNRIIIAITKYERSRELPGKGDDTGAK